MNFLTTLMNIIQKLKIEKNILIDGLYH